MNILSKLFGGNQTPAGNNTATDSVPYSTSNASANAPQTGATSSGKVSLLKNAEAGLERHIVDLKKKGVDLTQHQARVGVIIDVSGSMDGVFSSGAMQETLIRLFPIAERFDDNGELEVFVFDNKCKQAKAMNLKNYEHYVKKELVAKGMGPKGGTNYASAIEKTYKYFDDKSPYPAFCIFITDGNTFDEDHTRAAIIASSNTKVFYQFIGIGGASFPFLEELDDIKGRKVDNTGFFKASSMSNLSDDELYQKILEQYPAWLKDMHIS